MSGGSGLEGNPFALDRFKPVEFLDMRLPKVLEGLAKQYGTRSEEHRKDRASPPSLTA
jgi:hypothetical protein